MPSIGCINVNIEMQQLSTIKIFEMKYLVTFKLEKLNEKEIFKLTF